MIGYFCYLRYINTNMQTNFAMQSIKQRNRQIINIGIFRSMYEWS